MNKRSLALITALGFAATACKDSTGVPELNNVSAEVLNGGLTRPLTSALATGMLASARGNVSGTYIVFSETLARDLYRLDANEQRFITETLGGISDPSGFVGGGVFNGFYSTIRTANTLVNGMPTATGLSAPEKAATIGLSQTIKALSYYRALEMRDSLGIAVDVNHPIDAPPAAFVCKPNALAFISTLLDSAKVNLAAGGTAFPFPMPSGFSLIGNFTTPAGTILFANALKGKVELYRGLDHAKPNPASFAAAIAALNASYLDVAGSMDKGPYNSYSTANNDAVNPVSDALIYLNPLVADSIQVGDLRSSKILTAPKRSLFGVSSTYQPTSSSPTGAITSPIGILKNSELILLRAQAEIEMGDLAAATADINTVRTKDGGLAPLPLLASKTAAINAVLYEKRYSLLNEGAQRFVDLRAYNRLNGTYLRKELATDPFQAALAIPKPEQDARGGGVIVPTCS
ncbi:MAG: hypothetical protein ABJE47_13340 [bacterium]